MDRIEIEREIRRLAPWYYAYDLKGVSTTITEPFDQHGHRRVDVAAISPELWRGKTILDVGCNEGGWAFSALQHGASHVEAFDCRPANVEKARFVASVLGHDNARFQVESADSWLQKHPGERFDHVFLCGLLYHLVDPWRTIQEYAAVARDGMLITTLLYGGADGYTPFPEIETIGASEDPSELSMMPNTLNTVLLEGAKHGLHPRYFWESRYGEFWGTCNVWLQRWRGCPGAIPWGGSRDTGRRLLASLFPREVTRESATSAQLSFELSLYNETHEALAVEGFLELRDENGDLLLSRGPLPLELDSRPRKGEGDRAAVVMDHSVELPGASRLFYLDVRLVGRDGTPVESVGLRIGRDG